MSAAYPICCQSAYCGRGSCTTRERMVQVSPGVWERREVPEVCPNLPVLQAVARAILFTHPTWIELE